MNKIIEAIREEREILMSLLNDHRGSLQFEKYKYMAIGFYLFIRRLQNVTEEEIIPEKDMNELLRSANKEE